MIKKIFTALFRVIRKLAKLFVEGIRKIGRFVARAWHKHPKITIIVAIVLVGGIAAFSVWLATRPDTTKSTSTNPIISNYQQQLPQLSKKAKDNPKDAKSLNDYAVALYATGDYQKAKEQYIAETKVNKSDATLQNNLGNTYRDLGEYDKAVAAYQESIKLNPKLLNGYINLANLYTYTLNKKDLGITTYQDALKNLPNNQELEVLLATAYEQSGDKAAAISAFQQVLSQDANNVAAQAGLKRLQ